jgi:hypothetical protein
MIKDIEDRATYRTWAAMRHRCNNPKNPSFGSHGARGIRVCAEWADSFAAFVRDMGLRPDGTCLDRYPDNDGNYEPGNCRWATFGENSCNRRDNRNYTVNGQTKCLTQWAREHGKTYAIVASRLKRGWSLEHALTTPVRATGVQA